jgi:murein DD-endopeptidase MepM/ murein hydrolase activator NlpD
MAYAWLLASLALPVIALSVLVAGEGASPDAATETHVVTAGENLTTIALRYGVTVEAIMQANGLNNPDVIYAGQELVIPRENVSGEQIYVVQSGDTLAAIASRYSVTIDALISANGLPGANSIAVGQQLAIPAATDDAGASAEAAAPADSSTTYTLQRGDSLYRISLIFGIDVDDIIAANDLANPNAVYPGLSLRIPDPEGAAVAEVRGETGSDTTGGTYTVTWGDTLAKIALSHNTTVDGLVAANGLASPDTIYPGQLLNIPEAGAAVRAAPAVTATSHEVASGETLAEIALLHGVTVHSLAAANDIKATTSIYPGMVLTVPAALAGSNSIRYASVGEGLCQAAEPERAGTGYFIRPTHGYIRTQNFHDLHPGIDLAPDTGSPVFAADGGTVVFAGWNPVGYGNLVVLDHGNGWRTYYAHLSAIHIGCQQWVARGTMIGEVGTTGNSTGPHLHFEMLRFGIAVDPDGYIRF